MQQVTRPSARQHTPASAESVSSFSGSLRTKILTTLLLHLNTGVTLTHRQRQRADAISRSLAWLFLHRTFYSLIETGSDQQTSPDAQALKGLETGWKNFQQASKANPPQRVLLHLPRSFWNSLGQQHRCRGVCAHLLGSVIIAGISF